MNNLERLNAVSEDIDTILANNLLADPDLVKIVLEDDIPWLIDYVTKVENFLSLCERPEIESNLVNTHMSGYFSAVKDLKRTVNDE